MQRITAILALVATLALAVVPARAATYVTDVPVLVAPPSAVVGPCASFQTLGNAGTTFVVPRSDAGYWDELTMLTVARETSTPLTFEDDGGTVAACSGGTLAQNLRLGQAQCLVESMSFAPLPACTTAFDVVPCSAFSRLDFTAACDSLFGAGAL